MITKVKGTYDLLFDETRRWQALEQKVRKIFEVYNYSEIRTPIMEYSKVFHRETEQSEMVTKETYNFLDRSDRELTLRPEGTAGVIRSYVENKLYVNQDVSKFYYMGPNFRYERPQKGRYRQFSQFGIEAVGSDSPYLDIEVVSLAYETIKRLGLKGVRVRINTLGDAESRKNYQEILVDHFSKHKETLCEDCQKRIDKNPLRILDCKIDKDHIALQTAPVPAEHLTPAAHERYMLVLKGLNEANIPYETAPKLVRGLDYYSHTVFEIEADIEGFGAQNVLGGGGCYQKLVQELGGPDLSGIGFAFGMERLLLALEAEDISLIDEDKLDAYILTFDNKDSLVSTTLLNQLRSNDIKAEMNYMNRNFKGQLKQAIKQNASYLLILGEEEIKNQMITIKNTKTETQETIPNKIVVKHLKELLKK
ncbi:Histidyl-tRNA synthetase [Alteracholeplasma palmae J233]|uniref:Histidine--tRNA ligase n=1 Tax=Alteracholeplasma palmae (strain ATCC 49389 / J233) TaxID=1318466 RepID=U4KL94_ALTPJ|nr:histidine--tRNA ligase [Alteracholeplasma palmae]CCV64543.1 Histidyl-tRNA synthetase [Alteracholeplasma palmae J233]